jgi:hypothetical protein
MSRTAARFLLLPILSAVALTVTLPRAIRAEGLGKHPRVAELEDRLAKDASTYLRGRFPDAPFLVTVSVDPLRRVEGKTGGQNSGDERLPYFDVQTEEILDEWDDPQVSLGSVMLRVRKILVTISLPDSTRDSEAVEIKDSIHALLHLVPARDEVKIERRAWQTGPDPRVWGSAAFLALVLFMMGLFAVQRASTNRLAKALLDSKAQGGGGGGNPAALAAAAAAAPAAEAPGRGREAPGSLGGDLRFSDPIRIREMLLSCQTALAQSPSFPSLEDMIELDRLGRRDPRLLGAILGEFPLETRRRLFALSFSSSWLEALTRSGSVTMEGLELMQRLARNQSNQPTGPWEELLLAVWRLDDLRTGYIKQISTEEAMAILADLPRDLGLPTARRAFPGSWGSLLDPSFTPQRPKSERIRQLIAKAHEVRPLQDLAHVERYRRDLELLDYARAADPREEREIYDALPRDSLVATLRPAFFRALELPEAGRRELVQRVSVQQWALALFNVSRDDRKPIEELFGEKLRFLFAERMKRLDQTPPERESVSAARDAIARQAHEIRVALKSAEAASLAEAANPAKEPTEDVQARAA